MFFWATPQGSYCFYHHGRRRHRVFAALFRVNALVLLGRVNVFRPALATLGRVNVFRPALATLGRVNVFRPALATLGRVNVFRPALATLGRVNLMGRHWVYFRLWLKPGRPIPPRLRCALPGKLHPLVRRYAMAKMLWLYKLRFINLGLYNHKMRPVFSSGVSIDEAPAAPLLSLKGIGGYQGGLHSRNYSGD